MVLSVSLLVQWAAQSIVSGTFYCDARTRSPGDGVFKLQCVEKKKKTKKV